MQNQLNPNRTVSLEPEPNRFSAGLSMKTRLGKNGSTEKFWKFQFTESVREFEPKNWPLLLHWHDYRNFFFFFIEYSHDKWHLAYIWVRLLRLNFLIGRLFKLKTIMNYVIINAEIFSLWYIVAVFIASYFLAEFQL